MTNNIPELLIRLTLAGSIAIALVLLLRRPLRAALGAASAYQIWLIVPVMLAVAMLPSLRSMPQPVMVVLNAMPAAALAPAIAPRLAMDWSGWLLLAWASGALLAAASFVFEHRRFVRRLGPLSQQDAALFSASGTEGPLLLGLLRPKLVLPEDFAQRYSASEQALIVAHENTHAARRDPAANLLFTFLQCCFWFNPLVHAAAPRFRLDQELACDATVMANYPGTAKAYASAMLKTQMGEAATLASCHWQSQHPLKERIMNLQQSPLAPSRRLAGRLAIGLLVLAGAGATLLARADTALPASAKGARYEINMTITALGKTSKPLLHVREGEPFNISTGNDKETWAGEFLLKAANGKVFVSSKLTLNDKPMGEPTMLMAPGQVASLSISSDDGKANFKLDMAARPMPESAAK